MCIINHKSMMFKTRRGSKKCIKRKQTRRMRHCNKGKGGAPKVDPTSEKSKSEKPKEEAETMVQVQSVQSPPHHSLVPAADLRLSFDQAARDAFLVQGARAAHMMQHLGIQTPNIHRFDPQSAVRAPLESARTRVMIESIHASVDRLRARGDFARVVVQLDRALELGSIRARVELADILYDGRVGPISSADEDTDRARALLNVDDPVVRTNPDCMGLRVFFELENSSNDLDRQFNDLFDDAKKSAATHSKYGMFAFAKCCSDWQRSRDRPDSVPASWYFERCSNEANYDRAQDALGSIGMAASAHIQVASPDEAQDERDQASWYFAFAANQGLRLAMFHLGDLCRVEATRLHAMVDAGLHTMVDAEEFQRLISDAIYWYQLSKYPCDSQLQELANMEVALLGLGITRMRL